MSVRAVGLPMEIAFAVVGDEKRPDSEVAIVCPEVAVAAVEFGEDACRLLGFENGAAHGGVPKLLGEFQVLLLRNFAKLAAMLGIVFVELGAGTESRSGSP